MKEAELKKEVEKYLAGRELIGTFYWDRCNSGHLLAKYGRNYRRINLHRNGTADYVVFYSNIDRFKDDGVMWLELKGEGGKQNADQIVFQNTVRSLGHQYYIIRTIEDLEVVFGAY